MKHFRSNRKFLKLGPRSGSAQSFIELSIGIVILVPVLLVLLDLAVMIFGVEANDSNCRKAARAAAAGDPSFAQARAETALGNDGRNLGMVTYSHLVGTVGVKVLSQPEAEQDIASGKEIFPGGPVIGSTTVSTEIQVRPIIVHVLYGAKSPMSFTSTHTFPISHVLSAK